MRSRENSRMSDQMITFIFPTSTWRPTQEVHFGDAIKDEIVFLKYLFILFISLAVPGLSCSMWDQVPWPGIEPWPPALGAQSLSRWTTREVQDLRLQSLNAEVRHKHGNSRCVSQVSRTHGLAVLSLRKRIICFHLEKPAERGSGEDWAVFHYEAVPRLSIQVVMLENWSMLWGPWVRGSNHFFKNLAQNVLQE